MKKGRFARVGAWVLVVFTGVLIFGTGVGRVLRPQVPHVEVDREAFPVVGLDLSAHNGAVDFDSVAAAGVDFVYLKATEGLTFTDAAFIRNFSAARRAGLAIGAYHFFRFDADGISQARHLLDALHELRVDLPLAIDVEEWGNPAEVPTPQVVERLQTMVAELEHAGYPVIVYTNKNGHGRFLRALDVDLWICSFTSPPLAHPWRLWQHSHLGRVPGVNGKVDMDTFNGSREQWEAWLKNLYCP